MINSDNSFKISPLFCLVEILPAYAECEKKGRRRFIGRFLFLPQLFKTERMYNVSHYTVGFQIYAR